MFTGSFVALVTPFQEGKLDDRAYQEFIEWQISEGTDGVVPCGTTGESPTLTHEEHERCIALCLEVARGRVPVIAGSGSNSTAEAIRLTRYAAQAGADAALVVMPYYNKPTQEGLYQHFRAVHEAADIPIIIYNIPGRSVVDMSVETMSRLAELKNIVGVKDATKDLVRPLRTRTEIGPDFCQLSGEDATIAAFLAQGGHGCISVTANVAPALCAGLHQAWYKGDINRFFELRDQILPLHQAMFVESNPVPAKYALSLMGKASAEVRQPLVQLSPDSRGCVENAMELCGIGRT